MAIFLDRIDAVPLGYDDLSFELDSWLSLVPDTLNENFQEIELAFNNLAAPQYTTLEITTLAVDAPNGALWYDTTTNQLKAKVNGVVVVIV